ncbi:molybdopterin molybdenumtransferase MoeA [Sphingomonas gilva]|uniref:Molybdopterin molybdenumtransferase n=1 Tax=Sphingomonas gilva TaxID=2305907 RepID=A0A396RK37_9SPHN|nr:gephyrin-like molybdotransferase Glp [Sphingomonas gilva]RHW16379.1 molybdopterin molybdenumtransferase MoeA [Sphingomonas gilva]
MADLLPVAEAQARLLALAPAVAVETVPLAQAVGRWTAAPVIAARDQPFADLSAMDGYALRFADLGQPLKVVGESAAGKGFLGSVAAGEAVRIFTGAPVPDGADTILVQEEAARDGDGLALSGKGPLRIGAHIRPRAQDFAAGAEIISGGAHLTPAMIGLAAAAGYGALPVRRAVRVAILSTGDELVPAGAPASGAQLPSSNAPMLAALLADLPVTVLDGGIVRDDLAAMTAAFTALDADVIVTTGGASVGDHDLVRPALLAAGGSLDFWKIAMRPGKPLLAGRLGGAVVLGLPGNPVSAFVTATLFLRPLIAHLSGAADPFPRRLSAPLAHPLPANGPREDYMRARLTSAGLDAWPVQDSGMLAALAGSDALIVRPVHAPPVAAGDLAEYLPIA